MNTKNFSPRCGFAAGCQGFWTNLMAARKKEKLNIGNTSTNWLSRSEIWKRRSRLFNKVLHMYVAVVFPYPLGWGVTLNPKLVQKESVAVNKLEELLVAEESFWNQRAKSQLLWDGDRNTKFFNAAFTKHNSCQETSNPTAIPEDFQFRYVISPSDIVGLCHIPSCDEIEAAIKSIGPTKVLEPDGLPSLFFRQAWPPSKLIQNFSLSRKFSDRVNNTNLVFILKKE